ncbi:MAG TPA: cupredoxin domain-containing protein [Sphingomonas sp.]|nr:cupredoxin domain-containing protein [Sphingomonas sp.]
MIKTLLTLALIAVAIPAVAAPAPRPATVAVRMQDRKFTPQIIRMKAGRPTRLLFINRDRTEHDFYAPAFFGSARMSPRDVGALSKNRVNVRSGETRVITVTPRAGHYDVKSTKALDVASGMQGQILVF